MSLGKDFDTKKFENELIKSGYEDIINSPFLQRLKGVSFLATMDHIYSVKQPFSRYDHSLGAAYLSLNLAKHLNLEKNQTEVLVITSLLHDIGHAPFSHAAETFLLEKKRKYHEGLISSYLRFNTRILPESFSLSEILSNRPKKVESAITNLLLNKPTGDKVIDSIHYCSISCDKIDGTNRTLFSLGLGHHSPISLLSGFSIDGSTVLFNRGNINQIVAFWEDKKKLYNKYIYNNDILSAEAMLTRSLDITFNSKELINIFIGSTDQEVYRHLNNNIQSQFIIDSFASNNMFLALSNIDSKYFMKIGPRLIKVRFDFEKRKDIEAEVASRFGINRQFAISHFSFKKEFKTNLSRMYQLELFNKSHYTMTLEKLNKTFFSVRLSGDVKIDC
jgi:HD superfamily phosphohydrolase